MNLYIRDFPEVLHKQLRMVAEMKNSSLKDIILDILIREIEFGINRLNLSEEQIKVVHSIIFSEEN